MKLRHYVSFLLNPFQIEQYQLIHCLGIRSYRLICTGQEKMAKYNLSISISISIYIIKVEDVAIFLPCGIYGNVFYLTLIILVGQITPHGRILLVMYLHVSIYLIIIGYFMTFLNHFWGHASIRVRLQNQNGLNITTTKSTNLPS